MRQVAGFLGLFALLTVTAGYGGRQTTTTTGDVTTTVVQDSQWVTAAISAGAVLINSAAAAWITHYFTGRTERRRQQHAALEVAKRDHEAKPAHEQRIREQVIATSTTISKMLQDFRAKIGEATEAPDTLAVTLLYDECAAVVRRHHDDALPVIEVMPDLELRQRANAVFEAHGEWAAGTAEALSNSRGDRMPQGWTSVATAGRAAGVWSAFSPECTSGAFGRPKPWGCPSRI
ncbi:hypothetical protein ACFXEL_01370 [Streptomyces sp. NPDC059382]|uniref:hypothetical protein n=1 Tax=Streptomyces sp. NPDC059382 TaxID=3346816 RepID=UPI00369CCFB4